MGNLSGLFNNVNQQVAAIIIVTNTWNIVMGGIGYGAKCGYTGAGIISSDRLSSVNRKRRGLQLYGLAPISGPVSRLKEHEHNHVFPDWLKGRPYSSDFIPAVLLNRRADQKKRRASVQVNIHDGFTGGRRWNCESQAKRRLSYLLEQETDCESVHGECGQPAVRLHCCEN